MAFGSLQMFTTRNSSLALLLFLMWMQENLVLLAH
jgi:hypothetical protein